VFLDRTEISKNQLRSENLYFPWCQFVSPSDLNLSVRTEIFEILVPEDQELPLRSKQCKLVEPCVTQLRDLDTSDFSANVWADVIRLGARAEEVWFGGVSATAWVNMVCETST